MKKDKNIKQATVFLMAFVLVVGLAGAGGLVYGEADDTDTSDVTLDVSSIEAQIVVTELTIVTDENYDGTNTNTYNIIEWDEDTEEQVHNYVDINDPQWIDTITVEVEVSVADGTQLEGNIDYAQVEIWTEQGEAEKGSWTDPGDATGENPRDMTDGDAHNMYGILWGHDVFDGENGDAMTLLYTWDITGDQDATVHDHLLRAGGPIHDWEVEAYVLDEEGGEDFDNPVSGEPGETTFDVSTFTYITVANAPETPTVAPGDTASPADFGYAQFEFTINAAWQIDFDDFSLNHDDDQDTIGVEYTDAGYNDINTDSVNGLSPTANDMTYDVHYQVEVPAGTISGTYSGTVTHNLYNVDA